MSPEQKLYREAASHDKPLRQKEKGPATHSQSQKAATVSGKGGKGGNGKGAINVNVPRKDSTDDLKIVEKASEDDREDKASEAGTYTIEVDEEEQDEVEAARKRIDEVFGVLSESSQTVSDRPLVDLRLTSPGGYDNVTDDNVDGDRTPQEVDGFIGADDLALGDGEEEERGQEEEGEEDEVSRNWLLLWLFLFLVMVFAFFAVF